MHKDLAAMFRLRLRLQQYSMNCEFPPRARQANLQKTTDMKMIVRTSKGDQAAKGHKFWFIWTPMNSMSISCPLQKHLRNTENHRKTFPEVGLTEV